VTGSESALNWPPSNELRGNPLRWMRSTREDRPGFSRQGPGGRSSEDPRVRVEPRTKGEKEPNSLLGTRAETLKYTGTTRAAGESR
jgi:hypothetical protein